MWRQNIEQAEEERKRHTAIIEEYKKVSVECSFFFVKLLQFLYSYGHLMTVLCYRSALRWMKEARS